MSVRVAALQIASIPSLRWPHRERHRPVDTDDNFFLFFQDPSQGTVLDSAIAAEDGLHRLWGRLFDKYRDFQKSYCEGFEAQVLEVLNKLLTQEKDAKPDLIVFPEYAVPGFALEAIAKFSAENQIAIVAGTHSAHVSEIIAEAPSHPYAARIANDINFEALDPATVAVCPVFDGKTTTPHLTYKLIHSHYESEPMVFSAPTGQKRTALTLQTRGGVSYKLGVAICYEFLDRDGLRKVDSDPNELETDRTLEDIRSSLRDVDVIAVPAMTPLQSINHFLDRIKDLQNARSAPSIVLSNWAMGGNSGIFDGSEHKARMKGALTDPETQACVISTLPIGPKQDGHTESRARNYVFYPDGIQWRLFAKINDDLLNWAKRAHGDNDMENLSQILHRNTLVPIFDKELGQLNSQPDLTRGKLEQYKNFLQDRRSPIQNNAIILSQENCKSLRAIDDFTVEFRAYYAQDLQKSILSSKDLFHEHHEALIKGVATYGFSNLGGRNPENETDLIDSVGLSNTPMREDNETFLKDIPEQHDTKCITLRIATIPSEDFAIAHEHKLYWIVSEILRRVESVHAFDLTFWAFPHAGSVNIEVLLSFWIAGGNQSEAIARELEIALDKSLPCHVIEPVRVWQGILGDSDRDLKKMAGNTSSTYASFAIVPEEAGFAGLSEASKVLRALEKTKSNCRLRIHVGKPDCETAGTKNNVDLANTHAERRLGPEARVETSIADLQELRSAQLALRAEPRLFPAASGPSNNPFRARIIFESTNCSTGIVAQFLALELAGPMGAEAIKVDPPKAHLFEPLKTTNGVNLTDSDLLYLLRLPFGNLPSYQTRNRKEFSLSSGDLPPSDEGILLGMAEVDTNERKEFWLSDRARRQHMHILGKSGSGKSHFMSRMVLQDIEQGGGLMMIDPHGDIAEAVLRQIPPRRLDDVILFDPSNPRRSPGLNIFDTDLGSSTARSLVVEEATAIFLKLHGPEIFGPRIQNYFRGAIHSLMDYRMAQGELPTLVDLASIFVDEDLMKDVRKAARSDISKLFWMEYDASLAREKGEMIPYFQAKFSSFIGNDIMKNSIGQSQSSFDLDDVISKNKILIVNLSKGLVGTLNSSLMGMVIVAKLNWAMMRRASVDPNARHTFSLYIDEFQNFASSSFAEMLAEARKFGLSMVLVNQYLNQLKINNPWVREDPNALIDAINGNVATRVCFRISHHDAEAMAIEMRCRQKTFQHDTLIDALSDQPERSAIIATMRGNQRLKPFYIESLPFSLTKLSDERLEKLKLAAMESASPIDQVTKGDIQSVLRK